MSGRPAWSGAFSADNLQSLRPFGLIDDVITPELAWGGSTGRGVKVAVVDTGIDAEHPAVGRVSGYAGVSENAAGEVVVSTDPHTDSYGHGTACAGVIRSLAPDCELYSVKVLGTGMGRAAYFATGLRWAIENSIQVCNLSLGTTKKDFFGLFHELADQAYFRNVMLVTAANNNPVPSYPSIYASVISVAAHEQPDPDRFYYNPEPPVEFGAPGIDVRVAWLEKGWITATGNSYAAPHISGRIALILAKHPNLTIFQVKTILRALAANVERPMGAGGLL